MKKLAKILLFLIIPLGLSGQQTPSHDQYVLNPLLINPAYAGSRNTLSMGTFYHNQWTGIKGAPETITIAIDAPVLRERIGLGFILTSDKIGVTDQKFYTTNYSFKINIKEGILSLGLGAGILSTKEAWSKLDAIDPGDDFYMIDSRIFILPDFSFGAYYSHHNYFAGFSVPKLVNYTFDFDRNRYRLFHDISLYHYMFSTGYIYEINPTIKFFPSTLITWSPDEAIAYDINAYFNFLEKLWVGTSYRNKRAIAALVQVKIGSQLQLGYTYSYDIGPISRFSNGSHGIMLRYELNYRVSAVNPLIF